MNGTSKIIEGDNEKVHAWFTEHDRLYECHCDSCRAERTRAHDLRIRKEIRNEKIYNITGFAACFAIPLTLIASLSLIISGAQGNSTLLHWGLALAVTLAVEVLTTIIICTKTNPYK